MPPLSCFTSTPCNWENALSVLFSWFSHRCSDNRTSSQSIDSRDLCWIYRMHRFVARKSYSPPSIIFFLSGSSGKFSFRPSRCAFWCVLTDLLSGGAASDVLFICMYMWIYLLRSGFDLKTTKARVAKHDTYFVCSHHMLFWSITFQKGNMCEEIAHSILPLQNFHFITFQRKQTNFWRETCSTARIIQNMKPSLCIFHFFENFWEWMMEWTGY